MTEQMLQQQPQENSQGKENYSNLSNQHNCKESDDQNIIVGAGGLKYRKKA